MGFAAAGVVIAGPHERELLGPLGRADGAPPEPPDPRDPPEAPPLREEAEGRLPRVVRPRSTLPRRSVSWSCS